MEDSFSIFLLEVEIYCHKKFLKLSLGTNFFPVYLFIFIFFFVFFFFFFSRSVFFLL